MKPISEDCRRQTQKYTLLQNHGKKKAKNRSQLKFFLKQIKGVLKLDHYYILETHTQHLFKVKKKS